MPNNTKLLDIIQQNNKANISNDTAYFSSLKLKNFSSPNVTVN